MLPRVIDLSKDDQSTVSNRGSAVSSGAGPASTPTIVNRSVSAFMASTFPPKASRVHFDPNIKGREYSTGATLVDDPLMDKLEGMKTKFSARGLTWVDPHLGLGRAGYQQRFNWANSKIMVDSQYYRLTNKQVYYFWYPHWSWCRCQGCMKVAWGAFEYCEKKGWDNVYAL